MSGAAPTQNKREMGMVNTIWTGNPNALSKIP